MDNTLSRFYKVSELFRDDERLMASAIKEHTEVKDTKCSIYKDLLNCKYGKWVARLENIKHIATDEWMNYKEFMMDNGHDKVFAKGDMKTIEYICYEDE